VRFRSQGRGTEKALLLKGYASTPVNNEAMDGCRSGKEKLRFIHVEI
jgi:hypothetical protein